MARKGHTVHVVCRRITRKQPKVEVMAGFWVHRIYRGIVAPLPWSTYFPTQLKASRSDTWYERLYSVYLTMVHSLIIGLIGSTIIQRKNIDVILERESSLGAGAIASFITGRPLVLEVIGPRISRLSLSRSSRILAYTENSLPEAVQVRRKMVKVSAAADTDRFRPDSKKGMSVRQKLGLQKFVVVGYAGSFAPWHGVEEIIAAAMLVRKNIPDVRFLMVGPYSHRYEEIAHEAGISDAFLFTGPIPYDDVPSYLNAADVLVGPFNPSRSLMMSSGFLFSPLKVFEYMACQKPMVVTSVPIVSEIVQDGFNGVIVPPGNPSALAQALTRILTDPKLADRIGSSARRTVVESYSWEAFTDRLTKLLAQVIAEQS